VAGTAEALPVPDASIDTVVCTLVLCSVDDPEAAARELHRVLRPDGRLLLLEHVRAESARLARLQDRCDLVWGRLSGGCHLTRDTRAVLIRAGFDDTGVRERHLGKLMPLLDRAIAGVAVPR
jgi:SAM-dependent methyltransferase